MTNHKRSGWSYTHDIRYFPLLHLMTLHFCLIVRIQSWIFIFLVINISDKQILCQKIGLPPDD